MIGILAYGSLIANSGSELEEIIIHRIPCKTPFEIEYARRSNSRENAPTLVDVPRGVGAAVNGLILVLKPFTRKKKAKNLLYRRELHQDSNHDLVYDDAAQRLKRNALVIETLPHFQNLSQVYYTSLRATFSEILNLSLSVELKAVLLAQAAIDSLTQKTFKKSEDGIQYLHNNIEAGIITPLTEPYRQVLLKRANNSPDLPTARLYFAYQKGLIQ